MKNLLITILLLFSICQAQVPRDTSKSSGKWIMRSDNDYRQSKIYSSEAHMYEKMGKDSTYSSKDREHFLLSSVTFYEIANKLLEASIEEYLRAYLEFSKEQHKGL